MCNNIDPGIEQLCEREQTLSCKVQDQIHGQKIGLENRISERVYCCNRVTAGGEMTALSAWPDPKHITSTPEHYAWIQTIPSTHSKDVREEIAEAWHVLLGLLDNCHNNLFYPLFTIAPVSHRWKREIPGVKTGFLGDIHECVNEP
jgi:hypothetical protein